MPAVTRRRTGPAYLPASYYRAVAAGGAVDLPPGEWRLGSPLATTRAVQLTATAGRCWLTSDSWTCLKIASPYRGFVAGPPVRHESRLTGTVTSGGTSLTLAESGNAPAVGEHVVVCLGVNRDDPAEYAACLTRTVADVSGGVVTFTQPFGRDIPAYTVRGLADLFPEDEFWAEKLGPWGEWRGATGQYRKGYGTDHGLLRFGPTGVVSGVTLDNIGFRQPNTDPARRPAGAETVRFEHVHGATLTDLRFDGGAGPGVLLVQCESVSATGLQAAGDCYYRYGAGQTTRCPVVQLYGGRGVTLTDTTVRGRNWQYVATEISPENLTLDLADIDSPAVGLTEEHGQLYITGAAPGLQFVRPVTIRGGLMVNAPVRPAPFPATEPIPPSAVNLIA